MTNDHSDKERDLRELRDIMPSLRKMVANRENIERIIGHLIDDREIAKVIVDELLRVQQKEILPMIDRLEVIMPTLEKSVQNKERIEWLFQKGRRYGAAGLGAIILVSTFSEHAVKLWAAIKGLLWSVKSPGL